MKTILTTAFSLALLAATPVFAQYMQVSPNGSRPSAVGPAETFTGTVTVTSLLPAEAGANIGGGLVEFTPGARSAWHSHSAGQTLIVTQGMGWVQQDGAEKIEIRPGDIIWTPPGVMHWHGATSSTSMSHIAISPAGEGSDVTWLEQVTDEEYAQ